MLGQEANLSQEKQALIALRRMRTKLDELKAKRTEPIAIIGMGCRIPGGASSVDDFWQVLRNGVDAITEVPSDRWAIKDSLLVMPDLRNLPRTEMHRHPKDLRLPFPVFRLSSELQAAK